MLRQTAGILFSLAIVFSLSSCRRIDAPVSGLPKELLADSSSIPAAWGNLVSVSNSSMYPDLMQLWFQDGAGNIRQVVYSVRSGRFLNAALIRRQ